MSFNLEKLKAQSLKSIESVLRRLPGDKCVLVDASLIRQLDRVASMSALSSLDVRKVYKIQKLPPEASFERLVYLLPPNRESVQLIIDHVAVDKRSSITRTKLVAFVPKQTVAVRHLLESRGILGDSLQICDLSLGWIVLENDLVSLNLPELYTEYFLYGDISWPHHFGRMLGQLLDIVLGSVLDVATIKLHVLGSAAQVAAAGLKSSLNQQSAAAARTRSESVNEHSPRHDTRHSQSPMLLLFSRNLDYITPFLVPMTFEALIHEVVGIDNGIIQLPNVKKDEGIPQKVYLNSSSLSCYKDIRDSHISAVHGWLISHKMRMEDTRTGLDFSLTALGSTLSGPTGASAGPEQTTSISTKRNLSDLNTQLKPVLVMRRELTIMFICLEEVMRRMTKEERVEDLLNAQTTILQSGSGGALAMPSGREIIPFTFPRPTEDAMPPEAATGSCADDTASSPARLAFEWLSTNFGDRLIDAIRLLCLLSVTHDGLGEQFYQQVHRHLEHSVGFSVVPLLFALRRLNLLSVRRDVPSLHAGDKTPAIAEKPSSTQSPAEKLVASATALLGSRHKSTYNRMHRLLQLSLSSQTSLTAEKPVVSPTYVFGGQHSPLVVRLCESIWASGFSTNTGGPSFRSSGTIHSLFNSPELIQKDQLVQALSLLPIDKRCAENLGLVSLSDIASSADEHPTPSHGQLMIVTFVGGCTYAEIAALRYAAQRRCWRLLIVTCQIFSSRSLLQQVGKAVL